MGESIEREQDIGSSPRMVERVEEGNPEIQNPRLDLRNDEMMNQTCSPSPASPFTPLGAADRLGHIGKWTVMHKAEI